MKILLTFITLIFISSCSSTGKEYPSFSLDENNLSKYKEAFKTGNPKPFEFIYVADNNYLSQQKANVRNMSFLNKYGVVFLVLINKQGKVVNNKVIAGIKNMRGRNAGFYNQIVRKLTFQKSDTEKYREMVIPICLTYPLETY